MIKNQHPITQNYFGNYIEFPFTLNTNYVVRLESCVVLPERAFIISFDDLQF